MSRKRLIIGAIIFVFLGLIAFRLVQYSRKKKAEKSESEAPTQVKIALVKRGIIRQTIPLTGDVYGQQEVNIFARVPGKLSKKVRKEGDYVKKDQTIALIDRDEPGMDFTESEVKATISGIITNIYPDLNDSVFPAQGMGSKPVATVADMNKVKVVSYLSEAAYTDHFTCNTAFYNVHIYPALFPGIYFKFHHLNRISPGCGDAG